jgi:hypothetical protein
MKTKVSVSCVADIQFVMIHIKCCICVTPALRLPKDLNMLPGSHSYQLMQR